MEASQRRRDCIANRVVADSPSAGRKPFEEEAEPLDNAVRENGKDMMTDLFFETLVFTKFFLLPWNLSVCGNRSGRDMQLRVKTYICDRRMFLKTCETHDEDPSVS